MIGGGYGGGGDVHVSLHGRIRFGTAGENSSVNLAGYVHPTLVHAEFLARPEAAQGSLKALRADSIRGEILPGDESHLGATAFGLVYRHKLGKTSSSRSVVRLVVG